MKKPIPAYGGTLRSHILNVPKATYECTGMVIFGRRIKSLVFSTDVATIANINTDAVIAVYPFTPQPKISQAIISVSDVPVFVGVGGGLTSGDRSVRMAIEPDVITRIKSHVELPVVATIVSVTQDFQERVKAGADILNVSAAAATPDVVSHIRGFYPDLPIIATGGPTEDTIRATIRAGANAITYTPPANGDLLSRTMQNYRTTY